MKLERYSAYRDSGIEWLGEIPEDWNLIKLKYLANIKTGEKDTVDKEDNGIYPFFVRSKDIKTINTYTYNEEAVLTAGDGDIGKIFHYINGKFEYHQRVYKFSHFKYITGKYLYYYLHHNLEQEVVKLSAKTTVDSLRLPMLQNFNVLVPPKQEQQKIASFLDKKTKQIDQAIEQKEQLIELLKERRQILINDAVTKGLDRTVAMKDSGVEWIGEIPEHWEVKKNKYLFFEVDERSKEGKEELLSVSHMTGVTPRSEKNVNMFMSEDYTGSKTCSKNDLVINIMWAWMGAMGVSDRTGIVSSSYGIYRQIKKNTINSIYLEYLLKTNKYIEEYNKRSTGLHASRLRLYTDMFFDMKIGFAPKEEQKRIIDFIEKNNQKIDKAINLQQQQIKKLKEYKTTLIDSVVTGKVKVS